MLYGVSSLLTMVEDPFVFATKITPAKGGKPVRIELIDAKTKEPKQTLEMLLSLQLEGHHSQMGLLWKIQGRNTT
ncbi:hypothetical protein L2E82_51774 [Cichorium intybus]|nr:hypothetical protein L2E82_51774 [Cichorium intybus]